jgi:hypothetical protein
VALIKVLKFVNGLSTQANPDVDSIYALTFRVGGTSGTDFTKAILDTLSGGTASDATSLHSHDSRYFTKSQHLASSAGAGSAAAPVILDARGKLDPSLYQQSDISHSNLSGLSADDHPQYYNQTRGDARYYTQASFINVTTGVSDAGKPIKTDANGKIDSSFINSASSNHEQLSGLLGGASNDHYHFTGAEHTTLASGSADASALHNHNTQYYTKAQIDTSLALKADLTVVIKKDGSVAFTGNQSMGGNKLTNLADGSASTDATAYHQLTDGLALKLNKAGDTMSGALDMGGNLIHNLAPAVVGTDAINLNQLQNYLSGIEWRPAASYYDAVDTTKPATTATQIDGFTIATGDRVLFVNLTTGNNEVYTASVSAGNITWTLATDGGSGTGAPKTGDTILIEFGTAYAETTWNYNGSLWVQTNGAGSIQAGTGLTKSGNTLSVNMGAGVIELPTGEVGLDLRTDSGLDIVDPTTGLHSVADTAQLTLKLADSTLTKSASGVAVGVVQTANIADQSVTTAKHADASVTQAKLANASVGTAQIIDANVTTAKIADANVTGAKLAAAVAGIALAQNGVTKALDVQVDNTSVDVNGSNQLEVKALGITTAKIADAAVDVNKILFGTVGNGLNAAWIPLINAFGYFTATNAEAALNELSDDVYVTKAWQSGETIGQGDLVCIRRNASNVAQLFKASAASADNVIAATLTIADITYTAVNSIFFSGNSVSVAYTNPGAANSALAVTVSGNAISVSLATNGSSAITSTATQIQAAIAAYPAAAALVTAAITGTGSNIQTAHTAANLAGGADYNDNARWEVYGQAMDAAASAGTAIRVKKIGALTCTFVSAPAASDIGKDVYLSINQGKAAVAMAPSNTNEGIVVLGRLISATQVEFRSAILRGVNG